MNYEKISFLGAELRRWQVGRSTFVALPERGARLMNWHVELADGSMRDVLYWPELKSMENFHRTRGGNPILFPFSGRSFDQSENGFWRGADGVRRAIPIHGFARQGEFKVVRADAGGFSALFLPDAVAREGYPFDYEFTVDYRFESLGLFVELALRNLGRTPIPWSAGHHFYFAVPWTEGLSRQDYSVHVPAAHTMRQDMTTGQLVEHPKITDELLTNPALVDALHTQLTGTDAVLTERPTRDRLTLRLGTGKHAPAGSAVVTWTESPEAPFYCVEPWMGPPNAISHGQGLHYVDPGQTQRFVVEVTLR